MDVRRRIKDDGKRYDLDPAFSFGRCVSGRENGTTALTVPFAHVPSSTLRSFGLEVPPVHQCGQCWGWLVR
jgi:hypothetical protein